MSAESKVSGAPLVDEDTHPPPTEPRHAMLEPNANIPLYEGRMRVAGSEGTEGHGTVFLRWLPTPRIEFEIPSVRLFGTFGDCKLELLDVGRSCDAAVTSRGNGGLKGLVDRVGRVPGANPRVDRLQLHIPNFRRTRGEPLSHPNGDGWFSGRIRVEVQEWRLTLDKMAPKMHEALNATGGFGFTHVLVCERRDGAQFDPASADDFLHVLDAGLSFCLGRWTGCVLGTGYASGTVVWEDWRLPWLSSHGSNSTWFVDYPGSAVEGLLPAFVRAFEDPVRGRALRNCVHWYIEANAGHGGLEGAIIMALVALELLAWLEFVNGGGESPDDFDREPAHSKIRRYLAAKGIALQFPTDADLVDLVPFTSANHLADGVEAVTRIRNRSVHPPKKTGFEDYSIELREQAWRYSLHLLERAILAEVGYKGHMHDRTRRGWPCIVVP